MDFTFFSTTVKHCLVELVLHMDKGAAQVQLLTKLPALRVLHIIYPLQCRSGACPVLDLRQAPHLSRVIVEYKHCQRHVVRVLITGYSCQVSFVGLEWYCVPCAARQCPERTVTSRFSTTRRWQRSSMSPVALRGQLSRMLGVLP